MKALGPVLAASLLGWTAGCAAHEDGREVEAPPPENVVEPEPEPKPEPEPEPASASVTVSVASVQLQDDCPNPDAPAKGAASRSMPKPSVIEPAGDMADEPAELPGRRLARQACVQSRVQIAIESEADKALSFSVRAARLKNPDDGKALGEMTTRGPQVWEASKYQAWDESIPAEASIKVGYALGAPDWSKIDQVIGDSWGPLYVVELEVEIDGEVRTIVSPKIPRDEPENIVT